MTDNYVDSEGSLKSFTAANRVAWDDTASEHEKSRFEMLQCNFSDPEYLYLGDLEKSIFAQLQLADKSVVQLACNNGREAISIKRLGAKRSVGFDISRKFIEQGHALSEAAKVDCELIASDIYEIPDTYNGQFDLVFISVGALMLMPDLTVFMAVAKRLLTSEGKIFIYERHPMLDMFDWQDKNDPPAIVSSYFDTEPVKHEEFCNYWTKETYKCSPMYTFHHKLSDVFNALLNNGFTIEHFEEYEHDVSEMYITFEQLKLKPALCYTLIGSVVSG